MAVLSSDATSVGVFGGDPVVGRALEQILRSAGYSARFLTEASLEKAETLEELQILLFAGGLDAGRRGTSASILGGALAKVGLPVLELISSPGGTGKDGDGFLPWPCRADELKERIEAILLNVSPDQGKEVEDG